MSPILEVAGITVRFDGLTAVDDVAFAVAEREFVGLIGPNGAGKTTLLRAVTGSLRPAAGTVRLAGREIGALPVQLRARAGLGISHQIVRPFRTMTLVENVMLAAGMGRTSRPLRALAGRDRTQERSRAEELLRLVGIAGAAESRPEEVPLGVLKRLEVARTLAIEPRVLLLDEPLAGLNHAEAARLADTLAEINARGVTIVLIEHNLGEVMRVTRRLIVLDQGRLIADGPPREVMARADVRHAYLGEATDAAA